MGLVIDPLEALEQTFSRHEAPVPPCGLGDTHLRLKGPYIVATQQKTKGTSHQPQKMCPKPAGNVFPG